MISKLLNIIESNENLEPLNITWGARKTTRKMFKQICRINCQISADELEKRIKAFHVDGYSNIKLELHGKTFYYQGESKNYE